MKNTQALLNQLKDKFDLDVSYVTKNVELKVPPMIRLAYDTFYLKIGFIDFIAVIPKTDEDYSIKRLKVLQNNHEEPIIFIAESINAPMRKQLTNAKISYLSNDMIYLYQLFCYRENKIKKLKKTRIKLPTTAQPILLHMVYNNKLKEVYEIEDFKHLYNQTDATIYRKIIALEELNLIHKLENNTKKEFILNKDISLEELINSMNSPVKSTTYIYSEDFERVMQNNECLISGESALNEFNLAVGTKTFAIYHKEMKQPEWDKCNYASNYYEDYYKLELWHYEPKIMLNDFMQINSKIEVDPISLYLNLDKAERNNDIRVNDAMRNLYNYIMERFSW
jgi:hypothetical protein